MSEPYGGKSWNSTMRSVSTIAPADHAIDRLAGGEREDVEQREPVEQRRDVAARDHQRLGVGDHRPRSSARCRAITSRSPGRHRACERRADGRAALEVIVVELAELIDRDLLLLLEQLGLDVAHRDRARGLVGLVEPDPVEALHVAQPLLARLVRRGELGVAGEHLVARAWSLRLTAGTPSAAISSASSDSRSW